MIDHGTDATLAVIAAFGFSPDEMLDTMTDQEQEEYDRVRYSRDTDEQIFGHGTPIFDVRIAQ